MGFTRKRPGANGKTGYQALYDDARGVRQTAGTFSTKKQADQAWQRAEARIAEGKPGDPRGHQTAAEQGPKDSHPSQATLMDIAPSPPRSRFQPGNGMVGLLVMRSGVPLSP